MKKSILLLVVFFTCLAGTKAQTAPPFWKDILAFKKKDSARFPPANAILFTGSSSFTRWKNMADSFPGYPIINRGFGGSILKDVIRYAYDIIIPYKPKQVVIYCGDNDLVTADSVSAEEVALRMKTLFDMIRDNLPDARISYVSIKPSPSRMKYQEKAKEANRLIRSFLKKKKNTDFINVYDAMLETNGQMRPELYVEDMLHMKPEGYTIWTRIITPYLLK